MCTRTRNVSRPSYIHERHHACKNVCPTNTLVVWTFFLIQVDVYYERFSGGFSGDQFYCHIFYHGDGRFLGERGKVFNDFFQISRRGVGRVGLAKTAKPFCSKFEKSR